MGSLADTRRRLIGRWSRPMQLKRLSGGGGTPVTAVGLPVNGFFSMYRPDEISGDIKQGDAEVALTNDELAASNWTSPPRARDQIMIDGRTWQIVDAYPVYEGSDVIGHTLWVRGG